MFRTLICCVALTVGLSLNAVAAPACDEGECQPAAKSKPLDIMKFMKEQAAGTRQAAAGTTNPRPGKAQPVAHVQRPAHRAVAARSKPAGMPVEAAASYAAQEPAVKIVDSDELNDIDRAAPSTAPAETTGSAVATEPNVQLVDNGEFNDIDRKAEDRQPLSVASRIADAHASAGQASVSWLQWIWSSLGNTFAALAMAVHQLVGLWSLKAP
jgi:hypothetical protein